MKKQIKITALIKKETRVDQRTGNKGPYAALSLLKEDGSEYGVQRYLGGYDQLAALLQREAGVTYEELQDRRAAYESGKTVRLRLTVDTDEQIKNLGFDPKGS